MSTPVLKPLLKVPSTAKLQKLRLLQSQVFRTAYNPTNQRTGLKVLRQPLKGESIANYYGPSGFPTVSKLNKLWKNDEFEIIDQDEEYRLERVEDLKRRGKGAPKKIREAPSKTGKSKKK